MLEYLTVTSTRPERMRYGWDTDIDERITQVSYRLMLD